MRVRAAGLCRLLAFQIEEHDARALLAIDAPIACIESFPAAHDLLVAAREVATEGSWFFSPSSRCRQARAAGHHETVVVELLELSAFRGDAPAAWLVAACSVNGEADYWLRRLVRRCVELLGADYAASGRLVGGMTRS